MKAELSTQEELLAENAELRARLEEAEQALNAIRSGEVDALVIEGATGPQIFTLQGADAESNRFRGGILAQVSDAVITADDDDRVTYLNAAAELQYGVTASDALGVRLREIYETRWPRPEDEKAAADTLRDTGHWRGENLHVKRNGKVIHVESSVSRLRAANGEFFGVLAVIRDTTARKEAENKLQESEHFLQRVTEVTPGVIHVFDLQEKRNIFINRSVASLLGYEPEELESIRDEVVPGLMHPDDVPRFQEHMAKVRNLADDEFADFEHRMRGRSGEWHWFQSRDAIFARDGEGKVREIIGAAIEITERKRAEDALRGSEERFRKVFEHAATGIAITDWEGRFQRCNPAYCTLVGYTEEELRQIDFPSLVHPEDGPKNLAEIRRLQDEELSFFQIENRYIRKDGNPVWVHKFVSVLRNPSGEPTNLVALVTDVTERRRIEAALKEAKDHAENANRAKDEFLAALSHELRTPLAPVLLVAAMNKDDEAIAAETREDFAMIERNIALEARLIDDLLDITRVTRGKLVLQMERCDVHSLLRLVVKMLEAETREKTLDLTLEFAAPSPVLTGDPARLQQVFWNLLRNAVKFTPAGGRIHIRTYHRECLAGQHGNGQLCIEVRDSGIGFDPDSAERIFQPFEQELSSHTKRFGGLGLGLAIAQAVVDLHHGSLCAESAGLGQGATFTIELPASSPETVRGPR